MRSATTVMTGLLLLAASLGTRAETWVPVRGGSYALPSDVLAHIRSTLTAQVTAAATAQRQPLPPWSQFLLQYRTKRLDGRRVVEIHGACAVHSGQDIHTEFVDEGIADGGPCYFMVLYLLDSRQYSNVVFHGYG